MSNTVTPITTDISLAPSCAAKAKRRPMSAEQRAKLSAAQRAYVANDPVGGTPPQTGRGAGSQAHDA